MADNVRKPPTGAAAPPGAQKPATDGFTRRQVLRTGMFATIGAMFSTVAAGSGVMFWPIKLTGFGAPIPVPQKLSEIKMGEVVTVRDGKFYLTRSEDGLMALYWRCVHLGCTVPWNEAEQKFMCPCHGSVYSITGQKLAGPAPRALDQMEITIDGEQIIVNTGKITERAHHEPSMATKV